MAQKTEVPPSSFLTYQQYGINWMWYLNGEFNHHEMTVRIHFLGRFHKYDDARHPVVDDNVREFEEMTDNNGIYGIRIGSLEYLVLNPPKGQTYNDASHLKLEGGR